MQSADYSAAVGSGPYLSDHFAKDDPRVRRAYDWMLQEFDQGRQTAIEWQEIAHFFGPDIV
jgi:hypothetical protein